jgi:cob(I)alamin adenosyltransferase
VARRAERRLIAAARKRAELAAGVAYMNRLSDLLFHLARTANASDGAAEIPWKGGAA